MEFRVPATSANLGPGFDSLGLALNLYNHFSLKPSKFTSIQIHGEGAKNPKLRIDNVFVRIFNEQLKKLTGKTLHFKFTFDNSIPISRVWGVVQQLLSEQLVRLLKSLGFRSKSKKF